MAQQRRQPSGSRARPRSNLIYGLYVHLLAVVPELGLEDGITGVIHNRKSLLRLVRRDEQKRLPFGSLSDDDGRA